MAASTQSIYEVYDHQKTDLLLHLFKEVSELHTVIVILRTRDGAHALTTSLNHAGIIAESISGNKKIILRDRALKELKEGKIRALVATEAILRDLDLTGIHYVIQFESHELDQDYLHRLECAQKEVITFVPPKDDSLPKMLETLTGKELLQKQADGFAYDNQPRKIKPPGAKGSGPNKTGSKPLQNKKPKLKNKGPRRKTGRTRKR